MARWAVKPKTVGNSLAGAVDYDDVGLNWRVCKMKNLTWI